MTKSRIRARQTEFEHRFYKLWMRVCSAAFVLLFALKVIMKGHV